MPRLLTCSCGNQWEDDGADAPVCPACGTVSAPATAKSDTATVLHANWKSLGSVDQAPPVLPDCDLLEEIGRGGMGIVYRARRREDGAIFAIKVIRKDRLQHEEAVRRFRREAQAASRLSHPNIVTVHDSDRAGDTHYLVM